MVKKKQYEKNPYIDTVVSAIRVCAYEYGQARSDLEKDPEDERAVIAKNFCTDFISWLQDTTGMTGVELLAVIMRMTED